MPIYEQKYRKYDARAPLREARFWPITREALRMLLVRKAYLALLAVSWLPFLVRSIQIYFVTRFPQAEQALPIDGAMFGEFLHWQIFFTVLIVIFGGAGLVANDLRSGAILVYLSRPLTRRDYILGKLGVLMALSLSVTLMPGLSLYGVAVGLAPRKFLVLDLLWIGPAIVLQSLVISLSVSLLALAVSALSRSARVSGLGLLGLLLGLELVRQILGLIVGRSKVTAMSMLTDLKSIGFWLFGVEPGRHDPAVWTAALVIVVAGFVCLRVLRSRVRAVEVVQ
jgi:ABC-2 type transport system permease protein